MKSNASTANLRLVAVALLCGLFFLFAMSVILLGTNLYRGIVADTDERYTQRTALSYIMNQARQYDLTGGISVEAFGDDDVLALREGGYVTRLYCYDGQLCSLYTEESLLLQPEHGVAVLPLDSLTLTQTDGRIIISANGYETSFTPHASGEVAQ